MSGSATVSPPRFSRPLLVLAAVGGLLLAGAVVLWVQYGTVVFYDMILAGLALCL